MKRILISYAAGSLGGLASCVIIWILGEIDLTHKLVAVIVSPLSPVRLYPRLVWGGIWGLLFLLPLWKSKTVARATVISLIPAAVQLLYIYPLQLHKGVGGVELGIFTPLMVVLREWLWGLTAAMAIRAAK